MNKDEAAALLKEVVRPDNGLHNAGWYVVWNPGDERATIDGDFTADELEAIAIWMRANYG